jgi:hypothetical protein
LHRGCHRDQRRVPLEDASTVDVEDEHAKAGDERCRKKHTWQSHDREQRCEDVALEQVHADVDGGGGGVSCCTPDTAALA